MTFDESLVAGNIVTFRWTAEHRPRRARDSPGRQCPDEEYKTSRASFMRDGRRGLGISQTFGGNLNVTNKFAE